MAQQKRPGGEAGRPATRPAARAARKRAGSRPTWWLAALGLIVAAGVVWLLTRDADGTTEPAAQATPGAPVPLSEAGDVDEGPRRTAVPDSRLIDAADDPRKGGANAPVRIVEFADYQCPSCGHFFATTAGALESLYGDRIEWVFLDFPLTQIHDRAMPAALGGECAARQGRFWPYHDLLFRNQARLSDRDLRGYAEEAGLDVGAWEGCVESPEARAAVEQDVDVGMELGVTGTPTFFVGGERIQGSAPVTSFMEVIDPLLQASPPAPDAPAAAPAGSSPAGAGGPPQRTGGTAPAAAGSGS